MIAALSCACHRGSVLCWAYVFKLWKALMRSLQLIVTVVLTLHVLALLPQWQRHYFHPRLVRRTMLGLILGLCQALIVMAAIEVMQFELHSVTDWLGAAVVLNLYLAVQNLLASYAFVWLHRPSAVLAQRMYWGIRPLAVLSTFCSALAGLAVAGLF